MSGCAVIVLAVLAICVNESVFDTPLLNTAVISSEYNRISAEKCWQVCVLVISHAGSRLFIYC